jgi:hypothetical protein
MIRTFSVSLLAVAALVLSVFFTRGRQPNAPAAAADDGVERTAVSLEELRRAGF